MKFFRIAKDGGPKSTVTGYWLAEIKSLFSIALLRFEDGSREEYHSHAFNSISWVLKGELVEQLINWRLADTRLVRYFPSLKPVITKRSTFHRVVSNGTSWVLTLRGPWDKQWREFDPASRTMTVLEDGRVPVVSYKR